MSLVTIINEKIEKIKPEVILTDLTKNTDPDTIAEFVNSKKKDDRIAIAANPNLTVEQMEQLSNDKVNGVKQALCYNKNLPIEIAQKLLDEEPNRLQFIAEYGGSQLDKLSLDHLATIKEKYDRGAIMARLLRSPELSDETITTLIEKYPDEITRERELFRNKNLSKKAVYMLIDHLIKNSKGFRDAALTRITSVRTDVVKESDLKKMDWKNNKDLRATIFYRSDMSEKFVIQAIEASTDDDSFSSFRDSINKGNPNAKSIGVLNALLRRYAQIDKFSFHQDFTLFGDNKNLPLDPKAMITVVEKMSKSEYMSQIENLTQNIAYPDYGLDNIPITKASVKKILTNPNIDIKRAEKIIMSISDKEIMGSEVIFSFPGNDNLHKVSDDVKKHVLVVSQNFGYWLKFVPAGKLVDEILDNLEDWIKYDSRSYGTDKPKWEILLRISENGEVNPAQVKKILKLKDKIIKEENVESYAQGGILTTLMNKSHKRPEAMKDIIAAGGDIWRVWLGDGTTYFQYDEKARKIIDKHALETNEVPERLLTSGNNNTFTKWVEYCNNAYRGEDKSEKMSKETAIKYLIHFIKYGDEGVKKLLQSNYLSDEWLEIPDVSAAMYEMSGNENYLPQEAKDMFLF